MSDPANASAKALIQSLTNPDPEQRLSYEDAQEKLNELMAAQQTEQSQDASAQAAPTTAANPEPEKKTFRLRFRERLHRSKEKTTERKSDAWLQAKQDLESSLPESSSKPCRQFKKEVTKALDAYQKDGDDKSLMTKLQNSTNDFLNSAQTGAEDKRAVRESIPKFGMALADMKKEAQQTQAHDAEPAPPSNSPGNR